MLDRIVLDYRPNILSLNVLVKFQHHPLLAEWGIGGGDHVLNNSYPLDQEVWIDVHGQSHLIAHIQLKYSTVELKDNEGALFWLTVGIGLCMPLPECSIVGVNRSQSCYTVVPADMLNIVQFMDDCCMLDCACARFLPWHLVIEGVG